MDRKIVGWAGQILKWNDLPFSAPLEAPFMITGGTNIIPLYTFDLGDNWIPVDTTTGGYGTPLNAIYGITGQYKNVWSYNGINMFFTSQTVSRVWWTNDGGHTMSFTDLTDLASYNARQFGTWTPDNNKAYITGWTNAAKILYSLDNFSSILESSTGQSNGNYPLILSGSKSGQYVYGGAGNSGGVINSSDYGANFTLTVLNGGAHTNTAICDDSGQYAMIHGNLAFGLFMTFDYGSSWSQINIETPSGYMFYDATMFMYITRTAVTNKFYFSIDQGGSWSNISFPAGVTSAAYLGLDQINKVVYLWQANAAAPNNKLWKLNDAKNGWDDVGTFANILGIVGLSEIGRGVGVIDNSSNVWFSPSPANSGSWTQIGNLLPNYPGDSKLKFINVI